MMDITNAIENLIEKIVTGTGEESLQYSEALLNLTKAKATHVVTLGEIAQQEKTK
jgi:hypothetical protein